MTEEDKTLRLLLVSKTTIENAEEIKQEEDSDAKNWLH